MIHDLLPLAVILLGGGTVGLIVKAVVDWRGTATGSLTAAARELVDPLRKELAAVRAEHAEERKHDQEEIKAVRAELAACKREAQELRGELAMARVEADDLRRDREQYREKDRLNRARIRDLERQLHDGL